MGRMLKECRLDAQKNIERIRDAYNDVVKDLGKVCVHEIGRGNLYRRISAKTGLSTKVIAYRLNHWRG